jgi:hypothetical protein
MSSTPRRSSNTACAISSRITHKCSGAVIGLQAAQFRTPTLWERRSLLQGGAQIQLSITRAAAMRHQRTIMTSAHTFSSSVKSRSNRTGSRPAHQPRNVALRKRAPSVGALRIGKGKYFPLPSPRQESTQLRRIAHRPQIHRPQGLPNAAHNGWGCTVNGNVMAKSQGRRSTTLVSLLTGETMTALVESPAGTRLGV